MTAQEREYMRRDGDDSLFPDSPVELKPPTQLLPDLSTQATKALRAATSAVEAEVRKLKDMIKSRDEQIEALKQTANQLTEANLSRPDMEPIVRCICMMLCGLVYCRPIDEADRTKIVAAADCGHSLLNDIAGREVNFPAARMMYEETSRMYFDFVNSVKA